jgi:hypothetical protein
MGVKFTFCGFVGGDERAFDRFTADDAIFPTEVPPATILRRSRENVLDFAKDLVDNHYIQFASAIGAGYSGVPLALTLYWVAESAVAGDVVWRAQFTNFATGESFTVIASGANKSVVSTAPGVLGNIQSAVIPFTQAEADALAAGDPYMLRIYRQSTDILDTMLDGAQLFRVTIEEA